MKTALLHLVTVQDVVAKQESLTVSHIDGSQAPIMLETLRRNRKTGQVILNFSQGHISSMQWIEKSVITKKV